MVEWLQSSLPALLQVILIDVVLPGDNAIIDGLAASPVAPELRRRVIFWGIVGAVALRIAFAALAWAHLKGLPANVPEATGAQGPRVLGSYTPGTLRT